MSQHRRPQIDREESGSTLTQPSLICLLSLWAGWSSSWSVMGANLPCFFGVSMFETERIMFSILKSCFFVFCFWCKTLSTTTRRRLELDLYRDYRRRDWLVGCLVSAHKTRLFGGECCSAEQHLTADTFLFFHRRRRCRRCRCSSLFAPPAHNNVRRARQRTITSGRACAKTIGIARARAFAHRSSRCALALSDIVWLAPPARLTQNIVCSCRPFRAKPARQGAASVSSFSGRSFVHSLAHSCRPL